MFWVRKHSWMGSGCTNSSCVSSPVLIFRPEASTDQMSSSQRDGASIKDATDEEPLAELQESQEGDEDASVGAAHAGTQICSVAMVHFWHSWILCVPSWSYTEFSQQPSQPEHEPEWCTCGAEVRRTPSEEKADALHRLSGQHSCHPLLFPAAAGGDHVPLTVLRPALDDLLQPPCHPVSSGAVWPGWGSRGRGDPPTVCSVGSQPPGGRDLSREAETFQRQGAVPESSTAASPPAAQRWPSGGLQGAGLASQAVLQPTLPPHAGQDGRGHGGREDFWGSGGPEGGEKFKFWPSASKHTTPLCHGRLHSGWFL